MGPAYSNTQCRTLHFYCKTMTCEAARARAVAISACARVCSDLKRAMMAQIELSRTLRGTLSFRMSAARISSQRTSLDSTWTALGATVRIEQSLRNFPAYQVTVFAPK